MGKTFLNLFLSNRAPGCSLVSRVVLLPLRAVLLPRVVLLPHLVLLPCMVTLILGCAPIRKPDPEPGYVAETAVKEAEPIVVRVTGYATFAETEHEKSPRHRLLAIRASKLDAYRALAERIYGLSINGRTSVQAMVMQDDWVRSMVDTTIRGGRVISVEEMEGGGGYTTVLEVTLSERFNDCLTGTNLFRRSDECRLPLPRGNYDGLQDFGTAPPMFSRQVADQYFIEGKPGSLAND